MAGPAPLLCLLLALLAVSAGATPHTTRKPGLCPPAPKYTCFVTPLPDTCKSNDSNCPDDQKCCTGGCGTSCMKPVIKKKKTGNCPTERPGTCYMLDPPDRCKSNDYNCPGSRKCCKVFCGKSCVKPATKKSGSCPPVPLGQCRRLNPPDRCESNDFNCPDRQKCCKGRCGKGCVEPVKKQKPGGCPPVSPFQCDQFPLPDKCKGNDANCPGDQKCCRGSCGKSCTKPRTEKSGRCPKAPKYTCYRYPLPNPCKNSDYNCPRRKKCCRGGCGNSCVNPVPEKRDCCPKPPGIQCLQYPLPDPCESLDSNCPGDQKCCPGSCGNSCVKPWPLPQDKPEC